MNGGNRGIWNDIDFNSWEVYSAASYSSGYKEKEKEKILEKKAIEKEVKVNRLQYSFFTNRTILL